MYLHLSALEIGGIFKHMLTETDAAFKTLRLWANKQGVDATVGKLEECLGLSTRSGFQACIGYNLAELTGIFNGAPATGIRLSYHTVSCYRHQ